MKQNVSTPLIIGAILLVVVVVAALGFVFLGGNNGDIKKENAPAYAREQQQKAGSTKAADYGKQYGQAPSGRPPSGPSGNSSSGSPYGR